MASQFYGTATARFPEAPVDGSTYGRKDAGWTVVSGTGDNFSYHTVPTSTTVIVPTNQQMSVHDTLTIVGTLSLAGNAELAVRS
tara:strand:+ start:11267 stop:11518 length:252 start_codon:yes stop_codon:yes gene_type:complete